MPEAVKLAKATLTEIELADGDRPSRDADPKFEVTVQFNPETLKVSYSNTLENKDQAGGSAVQFVSKSSTKLTVELWFDATVHPEARDVRKLTQKVNHFLTPKRKGGGQAKGKGKGKNDGMVPPPVRFLWGSFLFEGIVESMDETLEFFSAEGRPLRAKVGLTLSSQEIYFKIKELAGDQGVPGTSPQTPVAEGQSLQQTMDQQGSSDGWQDVARGNDLENPRRLPPGSRVDLGRRKPAGVTP